MKKARIGINGFGRIGRLILRACSERKDVEVVAINDPFISTDYAKYLLEHDSTQGAFLANIKFDENNLLHYSGYCGLDSWPDYRRSALYLSSGKADRMAYRKTW